MDAQWDDLRAVLGVVRGGTLAAAAAELGVNYTTIARRIARAEQRIGQTLFERLADGYRATEAGQIVARHASDMEDAHHALHRRLDAHDARLDGDLILTAPQLLFAHVLSPLLDAFAQAYPGINLRLRASNDLLDLNRREADMAIRISRDPGDTLKGLRIARQATASFASPDWAQRIEDDPAGPIDWLVYERYQSLPAVVTQSYPGSRVLMRFDDMVAMSGAAAAGLGVVRMPMFLGRTLPGLVQVPLLPPQPYLDVWAVAHPDVWPSKKLTALRDMLVPFFRSRRALFV